ncbi:MAG: alpha-ketoacid dehydrogenase subunit beta [Deltaproteobacteria bacterium]|nr:alpha-ketoacid dehydrogenase subunit beta [Deltaproteobacteria bacterium]
MKKINVQWAINNAIAEEMRRDPNVFIVGEDVGGPGGPFGVTRGLQAEFGAERAVDTPISEGAIVGLCCGAAASGLRPVAEIMFMNFITLAVEEFYNQGSKMRWMFGGQVKQPFVVRAMTAGGFGAGPHHSSSLEGWFASMPGMKVVMPSDAYTAKGLMKAAIRDDNPVLYVEPLSSYTVKMEIPADDYIVPIGKVRVMQEGSDVTIVSVGRMLKEAQAATKKLEADGMSVELLDICTVNPLPMEDIYESVKKTNRLAIIHEAKEVMGIGAEIAAAVQENLFDYLDAPVARCAAPFTHIAFQPLLEKHYLPDADKLVSKVKALVG